MHVEYDGIYAKLVHTEAEGVAFNAVRDHFAVLDENRFTIKSFQKKWWDGYHRLIDKNGYFPRGMTESVVHWLKDNGVDCQWAPYVQPKPHLAKRALTDSLTGIELWDHQRQMAYHLLMRGGGTVEGVTGSGKTESIALVMKLLLEDPETDVILCLVHLVGLADQTKRRLEKRSPALKSLCGLLAEGGRPAPHHRIVFATYQSVLSVLGLTKSKKARPPDEAMVGLLSRTTAIIIDECHHVSNNEYTTVLNTLGGVPVYQFSGTAEVDDPLRDWSIIGAAGPIVYRVGRVELEEKGIIAKAVACLREFPHEGKRKRVDWVPEKRTQPYWVDVILIDPEGNTTPGHVQIHPENGMIPPAGGFNFLLQEYARDSLILDLDRTYDMLGFCREAIKRGRNTIVLCERVSQVMFLFGLAKKDGFNVSYVHGDSDLKTRNRVKEQFGKGEINLLIASSIFDEGEDVENVGAVALASGGSSLVKLVQRIGRGVRKKVGGNWVPIFCPVDARNKYVKDHSIQRLEYLERAHITSEIAVGPWGGYLDELTQRMQA
jgi:superfamily II DNA or RNA helicase